MGYSHYQLAILFKKNDLNFKLKEFAPLFEKFSIFDYTTKEYSGNEASFKEFLERLEKFDVVDCSFSLVLGKKIQDVGVKIIKAYNPFLVSKESFDLLFFNSVTNPSDEVIDFFEDNLAKRLANKLNPEFIIGGECDSRVEGEGYVAGGSNRSVLQYDLEFSTNNWRLALSPYPGDAENYYFSGYFKKDQPILFDHTRPELQKDLKTLKEHLTETELKKLIKDYSHQTFEDSKGNVGTIRHHEKLKGLGEIHPAPNFYIRRKLRREGVKLYFGLLEMTLLSTGHYDTTFGSTIIGAETKEKIRELFNKIFPELSQRWYRAIPYHSSLVLESQTKMFWEKIPELLTEQERIDFGLE